MPNKRSYKQIMKSLELGDELPPPRPCRCCGQPLYPLKINKYVGFWVHHGADLEICASKNIVFPGKPTIAQNMNLQNKIIALWNNGEIQT